MTAPVRIREIAAGGDGVGTLEDGRTVFVPRSAPGDLLELADVRLLKRYARAQIGKIVEAGPHRVESRCGHYLDDSCGGCQVQHLSPEGQREARSRIVGAAIRRLAKRDLPDPEVEAAPSDWGYRARVTLHVQAGGRRIGFHPSDRPGEIFDLRRCEIADPELQRMWTAVRELRSMLPTGLEHIGLRVDREGGLHLVLEPADTTAWSGADRLHGELARRGQSHHLVGPDQGGAPRTLAGATRRFPPLSSNRSTPSWATGCAAGRSTNLVTVAAAWRGTCMGVSATRRRDSAKRGATVWSVDVDRSAWNGRWETAELLGHFDHEG